MTMLKDPSLGGKNNNLDVSWENKEPTVGTWKGSSWPKLGSREVSLEELTPKHSKYSTASHSLWSELFFLCYILLGQWINSWDKALVAGFLSHLGSTFRASAEVQDAFMTYTVYDDLITIKLIQEACKVLGEYDKGLFWFLRATIRKYNQFPLCGVVLSYKVFVNPELANAEPLLLEEI